MRDFMDMESRAGSSTARRSAYIGVACALLGSIGFAGKPVIIKMAYGYGVDVWTLLALRMLLALPFFLLMAWWAGAPDNFTRRDWGTMLALGFLGYCLGSYLDFAGLQYISASLGRLILFLYPTVVLLIGALYLRQRVTGRQIVSLLLSYGGIILVFREEGALHAPLQTTLLGAALVFGSAVTYAIYLVVGARVIARTGSMRFTAYASIFATMFVVAIFMGTHGPDRLVVASEVYGLTLLLAVFSTVLPLWLMAEGLKRLGANQVALVGCIGPLATMGLAGAVLGEPLTAIQLAGAALVLAGVFIISAKPQTSASRTHE